MAGLEPRPPFPVTHDSPGQSQQLGSQLANKALRFPRAELPSPGIVAAEGHEEPGGVWTRQEMDCFSFRLSVSLTRQ